MFGNFVRENTTTVSDVLTITLTAVTTFTRFSQEFGVGDPVFYAILNGNDREVGSGVVQAGNTLDRTTPESTLVGGVFDDASPSRITLSGVSVVYATNTAASLQALLAHILDDTKHRLINDAGSLATELFSASKIIASLATKSNTTHNHTGVYEPADATILKDADIGTAVQAYSVNIRVIQDNISAVVDPTVNDDSGDGYVPDSRWLNLVANKSFILVDATVGAAIWVDITAGVTDHGLLTGVLDDDHTQYGLVDGTRSFTKLQFTNNLYRDTATLNGTAIDGHVNLGSGTSVTGTAAQAYAFCTIGGGNNNTSTNTATTVCGGLDNDATAQYATAVGGRGNLSTGNYSFMGGGLFNFAQGSSSVVGGGNGCGATANYSSILGGRGNKANHTHAEAGGGGALTRANFDWVRGATDTATASVANNVARLTAAGDFKIDGAVSSPEADIAECIEWADGNPANEDRNGLITSVFEGKLILGDSNPAGIISAAPSVISNAAPNGWARTYLKDKHKRNIKTKYTLVAWVDEWGDEQYVYESQDKTLYDEYPQPTAVNGIVSEKIPVGNLKKEIIFTNTINPLYDIVLAESYVPRNERKEWGVVGVLGQIIGMTSENIVGWKVDADPDNPGYFINGTTYDVMEYIDETTVLVFYK